MAYEIGVRRRTEELLRKTLSERDEALRQRDESLKEAWWRSSVDRRHLEWLETVERAVEEAFADPSFWNEYETILREFVGEELQGNKTAEVDILSLINNAHAARRNLLD